jgi:hypothetical protein
MLLVGYWILAIAMWLVLFDLEWLAECERLTLPDREWMD